MMAAPAALRKPLMAGCLRALGARTTANPVCVTPRSPATQRPQFSFFSAPCSASPRLRD